MVYGNNLTVSMKPGELGTTIVATFKDANNKPIPLTGKTPWILIASRERNGARNIFIEKAMTPAASQASSGKGIAAYTFTDDEARDIPKGSHDIECVLVGESETTKFPKLPGKMFGTLVVSNTIKI